MSLLKLPDELLCLVFELVDAQPTFCALALTCRHLHQSVEPFFYSSFTQTYGAAIPCFLSTLFDNPHLALHVRRVTCCERNKERLHTGDDDVYMNTTMMRSMKHEFHEVLQLVDLSYEDERRWVRDIFTQLNWDACVAFLLLLLPSVEKLSLKVYRMPLHKFSEEGCVNYLHKFLQVADDHQDATDPTIPSRLAVLRSIRIEFAGKDGSVGEGLVPFLAFESIIEFELMGLNDREKYLLPMSNMLNIISLSLTNSLMSDETMRQLLGHMPNLKRLQHIDENAGWLRCNPNKKAWRDSIAQFTGTLEELALGSNNSRHFWDYDRAFGSLTHFHKLRQYRTNFSNLVAQTSPSRSGHRPPRGQAEEAFANSIRDLPTSLQELVLWECTGSILDWLDILLGLYQTGNNPLERLRKSSSGV